MAEKQLRSMDKVELLAIMRQQEIEIETLTNGRNEQIDQIEKLNDEIKKLILERAEQLEKLTHENLEKIRQNEQIQRLTLENERLIAEKERLIAEKEELAQKMDKRQFAHENAVSVVEAALAVAEKLEEEARKNSDEIIKDAEQKREEIIKNEKRAAVEMKNVAYSYMELISKTHTDLYEMAQKYKFIESQMIRVPSQTGDDI